jgi:para-aminobenzoate synthetase component 1
MPTCSRHALPYRADPADYFALLRDAPGAVLLDSGRPAASRGRYDIMSAWPRQVLAPHPGEAGAAFLDRLRQALRSLGQAEAPAPFSGGLIGYFGYDFGRRLERLPAQAEDDLGLPDAQLGLYDWALISDHQEASTLLIVHPSVPDAARERLLALFARPAPSTPGFELLAPFSADVSAREYRRAIDRIQAYIQAGDCYQVNYAQRFRARYTGDPWSAYRRLRQACPTPFAAFQSLGNGDALLSFSPERFLHVDEGAVETRPIKGTRPRGATPVEDAELARALLASAKDRAENLMIVDLLRNDLGRNCAIGSIRVPQLFALESYPNVHHLVSGITGTLAPGRDALDLLAGCFPGGSITGAPKVRAMQIIDELEPSRRTIYCGSLFYLDVRGKMDSSIAIRTLLAKDGQLCCWGGGGIVADSDWQAEYAESLTKVAVLMRTLENEAGA